AAYQAMDHPVADFAKNQMMLAVAGTGVHLSDGSTNILPLGEPEDVHRAWSLHAGLVRRHLKRGIYQGWDLHPHQLPTRFLATFAFYREGGPSAAQRLRHYVCQADSAALAEPAPATALPRCLGRGRAGRAPTREFVTTQTRPGLEHLKSRARTGRPHCHVSDARTGETTTPGSTH